MRRKRRSRSLQLRVLALVGAGVFAAGAVLSLLSRSTLVSLEREVAHDHARLAEALARDLSHAIETDVRLLARGPASWSLDAYGRLTASAFTARHDSPPNWRIRIRDGSGQILTGAPAGDGLITRAAVAGTPWTLEIEDRGADPLAPVARFRRNSIGLAPTLAALAMLLGWGIARSVRQPLVELTAAAERIAQGGFHQPIDTARVAAGGHEVERLAAALERMRAALASSFAEIERTNEELEWRVAERTHQLADANTRLEEREKARQALLRQVISAQEEERKRIARELHDETSQTLAALGMAVDVGALDRIRTLIDRMHEGLHRMIVNLRPSVLDDLGLAAAVRWLADYHLTRAGVSVRCEIDGLDERLPPEIETATFRMVQEALINIARHAHADSVLIQGTVTQTTLDIEIEDDGVGFEAPGMTWEPQSLRGAGLLGMQERVEALGGWMRIDSTPGAGTHVFFSIPVHDHRVIAGGAS